MAISEAGSSGGLSGVLERIEAGDCAGAIARLSRLDIRALAPPQFVRLGRALAGLEAPGQTLGVAYLANVTVSELPPFVAVWAAREGILTRQWVAPFDQLVQQVASPSSPLRAFSPDVVVLTVDARLLRPDAFYRFATLSTEARRGLSAEILAEITGVVRSVVDDLGAVAVVGNFVPPARPGAGVADSKMPLGETEFFDRLNLELLDRLRDDPRAQLLDLRSALAATGQAGRDPRRFYLAKIPWSGPAVPAVAEEVARHLVAAAGRAKKCIVVDLDDTLWGGVVGEDGVDGIRIGIGDPVGEAYLDVQRALLDLKERGILLAISSKNNEPDVREAFAGRSMLLSLDDFAATEIHWRPKHESLLAIADRLNIGVDSLLFLDDNPTEVALVQEALPEVRTVLLAGDPAEYPDRIRDELGFEKTRILAEDRGKTEQYRQQGRREQHRASVGDLEDYLGSLETVVRIRRPRQGDMGRLHQLFTKTNQFNLTTRRYSAARIRQLVADQATQVVIWEVSDRFGSLGIVGTYVTRRMGSILEIDSFLMSCRAMGRTVETAVMNHLKEEFLADDSVELVEGLYIPTRKNIPAASFYPDRGFRPAKETDRGSGVTPKNGARYRLTRPEAALEPCDWIKVESE